MLRLSKRERGLVRKHGNPRALEFPGFSEDLVGAVCEPPRIALGFHKEKVAPQGGFEPPTLRLTAGCSAVELLRNTERKSARGKERVV